MCFPAFCLLRRIPTTQRSTQRYLPFPVKLMLISLNLACEVWPVSPPLHRPGCTHAHWQSKQAPRAGCWHSRTALTVSPNFRRRFIEPARQPEVLLKPIKKRLSTFPVRKNHRPCRPAGRPTISLRPTSGKQD